METYRLKDFPDPELVAAAREARTRAHAPYSSFRVGAAVRAGSGRIWTGANVENAVYGLTVCAERVALWRAWMEGERAFVRLVVVSDRERWTPPCGACRQVMMELAGPALEVVLVQGEEVRVYRLRELLPLAFDREQLA